MMKHISFVRIPVSTLARFSALGMLAAVGLGSCTPPPLHPREDGPTFSISPLYDADQPWTGPVRSKSPISVLQASVLTSSEARFGGLSGLCFHDQRLTMISDRGYWFQLPATITDPTAHPQDSTIDRPTLVMGGLHDPEGHSLLDNDDRDAEGLICLPNGGHLISFERRHRLWYYPPTGNGHGVSRKAIAVPPPDGVQNLGYNAGLEAITLLPDGSLLMIAEGRDDQPQTDVWIGTVDGTWTDTAIPKIKWRHHTLAIELPFHPTAVRVLHDRDGAPRLVMTERSFRLATGFASRLSEIPWADFMAVFQGQKTGPLRSNPIADLSVPPLNDNWEGLAVDPRFPSWLWVLTDNNYNALQRTLLLELDLRPR